MFICTILTEDWVWRHGARWVRYLRGSNPGVGIGLVLVSDEGMRGDEVVGQFDKVVVYERKVAENRDFWNLVRMGATKIFEEERIIYCDADCDIVGDLGWLEEVRCGGVGFVRSPSVHRDWGDLMEWKDVWEGNNGFLVLEEDWTDRYGEALEAAVKSGAHPRIRGTVAFNLLLRKNLGKWRELPYKTSVIWWDAAHWLDADSIQYCNDAGQKKRVMLEEMWRQNGGEYAFDKKG